MEKIKVIKPEAVIDIKIGTGFLQRIQHVLIFLAKDLSPEQLAQYKKEADEKIPFTEEWMEHVTTLSTLLKELEINADTQGFSYEIDAPAIEEGN